MLTNADARSLVAQALTTGRPMTIPCPNGDTVTAGRWTPAVGAGGYQALRWGRSRLADLCGREVACWARAADLAADVVEHCGRGNAARAARAILAAERKSTNTG